MTVLVSPPAVPSKYDIIPIHASDISSFRRCRRYWSWSSPTRSNLRRRVELYGIYIPFWFGNGIHYALEKFYDPVLKRDPVETFQSWFALQWEGGQIWEDEVELSYDLNPVVLGGELGIGNLKGRGIEYQVRGLRDLLPSPDEEEFLGYRDLGVGMMSFYKDYAEREDDFECIAAESQFSIPLGFEAVDQREQSLNYNKKLEVHLRGKRDAILYFPDRKDPARQHVVHDYKTASVIGEDYFLKLENDPQASTYVFASVREAELNDLPWTGIQEVLFTALRKVFPKPPTITTRGYPSLDRQNESATAQMFEKCIRDLDLVEWFHSNEKAQGYYEYLLSEGDKVFIQRDYIPRNKYEVKATGEEITAIAKEMLSDPFIYKHPSGDRYCTRCQFRAPCLAKDDGSDWQQMLKDGYELNRDR